ncbi:galactokinase [Curtobacterium sp. MCJR17_055]|uniref:galactokinase n=1 Tax=unclassified Curtobacterium TaxID=257496 RepID=UPI000D9F0F9D|nr:MULTISPECIES: galactokinase [unclassified Curtobacterium]PYY37576.1 galactokinase [Curtobacterium sp. MCBD17_029]PYY56242.1 galactokinase [Curtobacterium sp. MCPF17_015]PYY56603.1 galactokinase [Curtobacterium sp. MCJR17_055]WIB35803.1 galactokinase [Curtobacterium sp. MCJR17_043]
MTFQQVYGYEPAVRYSAPGRVNLIGEHTDYNDGYVLPFAIDRRTVASIAQREDRLIRVASAFEPDAVHELSLDELSPENMDGWSAYVFGIAWALREQAGADLSDRTGFDVFIDSDVPVGAGLSSSAAIECGVALAFTDLWELGLDRKVLAKVGQYSENHAVGAPTGIMDQSASLLGEQDAVVFLDCRTLDTEVVDLALEANGLEVLVIDTRVEHAHATGGYKARRDSCERGAEVLGVPALRDVSVEDLPRAQELLDDETFRRVRHIVTEDQRVLDTVETLRADGPRAIGSLLVASHESMRDDFEISVPELDLAVDTAMANGAVGARMTGGGFGGSAIALVDREARERIAAAVTAAFADAGYREPTVFTVHAAQGARRDA